ncbi:transposase [Labrys miyagiensis]|uniref:Transposase n=1 Tax=Labrys miyagiensis TaxID=346912 RepID=A0ABQ6CI79_9HYPH|nr:transposase [Labrys miyagiensis]
MIRDNRHTNAYIFGAICPDRAVGAALLMPYANADAMNRHLEVISAEIAPGAHAILICDGAGWHQQGGRLVIPENITLIPLPPYCPELNPMENVWAYLRQNKLCATVWNTYNQILDACQSAWLFLINDPRRIRSIGTRQWAQVNI